MIWLIIKWSNLDEFAGEEQKLKYSDVNYIVVYHRLVPVVILDLETIHPLSTQKTGF